MSIARAYTAEQASCILASSRAFYAAFYLSSSSTSFLTSWSLIDSPLLHRKTCKENSALAHWFPSCRIDAHAADPCLRAFSARPVGVARSAASHLHDT